MNFIHANGVVAGPLPIIQAVAKRKCSLVKCGSNGQVSSLVNDSSRTGIICTPRKHSKAENCRVGSQPEFLCGLCGFFFADFAVRVFIDLDPQQELLTAKFAKVKAAKYAKTFKLRHYRSPGSLSGF